MYKNELTKIPDEEKGKISKRQMKNYVQIMYVFDAGYNAVKIDKLNMVLNSIEDLILLLKEVYLIPRREGELNGNNKNMEM